MVERGRKRGGTRDEGGNGGQVEGNDAMVRVRGGQGRRKSSCMVSSWLVLTLPVADVANQLLVRDGSPPPPPPPSAQAKPTASAPTPL